MKKILFAVVIVGIVLGMSSCDEEEVNPFIGTWESVEGARYVFTETKVTQSKITDDTVYWSGTYTYNDSHLTIDATYRAPPFDNLETYPNPFVWSYSFQDEKLIIGIFVGTKVLK